MTKLSMALKACIASAALGAMAASPASCDESGGAGTAASERLLQSQARLAAVLTDALAKAHPDENVIVSPASVAGTVTAIDLGGEASMHEAVAHALRIAPGPTAAEDVRALRDLTSRGPTDDDLTSATRIIFDASVPLQGDALSRLARAGVEASVADLGRQASVDDVNAWARRATRGKISRALAEVPSDAAMIAVNALYFVGGWKSEFDPFQTRPADFHTAKGRRILASFMHSQPEDLPIREDERFVAVDLPFSGGRFSMVVLTTKDGPADAASFSGHLAWLTGAGFASKSVLVDIPQFDAAGTTDLGAALAKSGLDPDVPLPNFTTAPLAAVKILQAVRMNVREEGVEVAAVTMEGFRTMGGSMFPRAEDIVVDKPFAFALRDRATGLIVVAGYIAEVAGDQVADDDPSKPARSPMAPRPGEPTAPPRPRGKPLPPPSEEVILRLQRDF